MQITFLGTSAMMPTKQRNTSAVLLEYKSDGILFDCGEATQKQLKIAGIPITKVTKILITHWHGDHVLGLPGLIQSLGSTEPPRKVEIYAPKGSSRLFKSMMEGIIFDFRAEVSFHEIETGTIIDEKDYSIETIPLKHKTKCNGYAFVEKDRSRIDVAAVKKIGIPQGPLLGELQRGKTITFKGKKITPEKTTYLVKGKKITYITDTILTENCAKLAKNSDLLITESSYTEELKDKAQERGHLTAKDAGTIAKKSGAKKLVLTHFSARYPDTREIEQEAKKQFENTTCAKDFMTIEL